MNKVILNIDSINNVKGLHMHLKDIFGFPHFYGENLDALYDCLTDIGEPTLVVMPARQELFKKFGSYGNLILQVFIESSICNKNLILENII